MIIYFCDPVIYQISFAPLDLLHRCLYSFYYSNNDNFRYVQVYYSKLSQKFNFMKTQWSRICNLANVVGLCNN